MSAALPLEPHYGHVESKEVVRLVVRLLDVDDPSVRARSVTLSGSTGNGGLVGLEGLGKEIWVGVDVQEYVNRLRDEWER